MRLFLLALPILLFSGTTFKIVDIQWQELEKGLNYASLNSPVRSSIGDSKIDILRIVPHYFKFNLLCAGEKKTDAKTLKQWCDDHKMIAGVNAGMFKLEGDFKTSTGYMKNGNYVNNPVLNKTYNSIFCFNPIDSGKTEARLADLRCENWNDLQKSYKGFSQGIRMLDCNSKNTWQLQEKKWSMVLLGEDSDSNILYIFVRSPYKVHDYINILLSLPINLKKLMYLEGGPEASFYINHFNLKVGKFGSYETGFTENDKNDRFWDIPNVLCISRK